MLRKNWDKNFMGCISEPISVRFLFSIVINLSTITQNLTESHNFTIPLRSGRNQASGWGQTVQHCWFNTTVFSQVPWTRCSCFTRLKLTMCCTNNAVQFDRSLVDFVYCWTLKKPESDHWRGQDFTISSLCRYHFIHNHPPGTRFEGSKNSPPGQSWCTKTLPSGQNRESKAPPPGT